MDHRRFDDLSRSLSGARSRRQLVRSFVGGLLGVSALAVGRSVEAAPACPAGAVRSRGRCLCKANGRPPVDGSCGVCLPDDSECTDDAECCNGSCSPCGYCYDPISSGGAAAAC
jgi:hypothetical protein